MKKYYISEWGMIRTGYDIPAHDGVGAGAAGKFFRRRRRRRRHLGVDPKKHWFVY